MADEKKTEYERVNEEGKHGVAELPAGMVFAPPLVPKDAEKTGAAAVVRPDSTATEQEKPEDQAARTKGRAK